MVKRLDPLSVEERSLRMSKIRGKNTGPELQVRKALFKLGYRYKLHDSRLPGRPDLVFPKRHKVIFVHGCFWHLHSCGNYSIPKTRQSFWLPKLRANVTRDRRNQRALRAMGWGVATVWECQLRDVPRLIRRLQRFLNLGALSTSPGISKKSS